MACWDSGTLSIKTLLGTFNHNRWIIILQRIFFLLFMNTV